MRGGISMGINKKHRRTLGGVFVSLNLIQYKHTSFNRDDAKCLMTITYNKIIKIFVVFALLLFVYFKFFYYLDLRNDCHIKIRMSWLEWSNLSIKRALVTLKYGSPDDYKKVCKHVRVINPNYACGGFQGGCFYTGADPREIHVSTSQRTLAWTIGIIMHETCHAVQFQAGRQMDERECYAEDDRILKKLVEF
jgi:hypothetical protein